MDITDDRSQRVHVESTGPHGHRLVVMNATAPTDDGQYKCTLGSTDDRNPREHIEFNLKLYRTTSFRDTTRHLVLPAGQQGTLNCKVEFDPNVSSATVSWVRDQRPIEMFNDTSYTVVDYDANSQLSQLIISPVTKQHDGIYTCRAVAVTAQLSKISDHDIHLETNYAPTFDKDSHTVWVERSSARGSGGHLSDQHHQANTYASGRPQGHQHQRNRFGKPHYPGSMSRKQLDQAADPSSASSEESNSTSSQTIRVELHCSCRANPPASILWTSTQNSNYVLSKGIYPHILEEPRVESDGTNTSSILVIGYSRDPEWPHRSDSYICSASNKLGKASKSFTIEQGDPPPAFNVGSIKQYNPQNSQFKFTLLGPNYDPETPGGGVSGHPGQLQAASQEIVPPVDSFRIRSENPQIVEQHRQHWRRHNDNSVQWSVTDQQMMGKLGASFGTPHNFTVGLGKLPSGNQKLYLEAHNAVGWSPNATYLGDYYIVSGAHSFLWRICNVNLILNLLGCLLIGSVITYRPTTLRF